MSEQKTVILANGTFPTSLHALEVLDGAERIVCCDGAAIALMASGRRPTAVIGDLDSISSELREQLRDLIVHVTEQDTNDLNKAFRYCLQRGWRDLVILGATGKREDHALGNISLLADFAIQVPGIRMVTDDGEFLVLSESGSVSCRKGQQVSLFALETGTALESTGLKWPLNGLMPDRWWQATLNEAMADSFSVCFETGRQVLVYLAE